MSHAYSATYVKAVIALRVVDVCRSDSLIMDGDWVVIREQPVTENHEIVAAMVEGDATVKTFRRSDGHIWLLPANRTMKE